jgi:ABC-type transport system involved in multi-copper enzyme maturation permease subunit
MTPSAALLTVRWLVRDTFRQALASGVFWLMLGVSAVCAGLCLTATLPADEAAGGHLELAFGALQLPLTQGRAHAVHTLQVHLAGWVADTAGLLLALLWTAGFLPSFLEADAVAVLLAKPVPRWSLLAGKFAGVLAFVAFQASAFLGATWLALGARTGLWGTAYFLCLPLLLLHFAVFFSFSAMLAVATRSTVACVFGSVLFWVVCWATNFGRHAAFRVAELKGLSPGFGRALERAYWVLPKPLDFHAVLLGALGAEDATAGLVDFPALAARGAWSPAASLTASALCGLALLACTAYDFLKADY